MRKFPDKKELVISLRAECSRVAQEMLAEGFSILSQGFYCGFKPRGRKNSLKYVNIAYKLLRLGNDQALSIVEDALDYFQKPKTKVFKVALKFACLRKVFMRKYPALWEYYLVLSINRKGDVEIRDRTICGIEIQKEIS